MSWQAWQWDWPTAWWSLWIAVFMVVETWALVTPVPHDTLTAHLRPLFAEHPLTYFLTLGLWLWLGQHFLVAGVDFGWFTESSGTG